MARKTMVSVIGDRTRKQVASQQMDLFRVALTEASVSGPAWPDLPESARNVLVGLMTQLILEHARTSAMPSEAVEAGDDR